MIKCVAFLLALGMAAATQTPGGVQKLPVFGFSESFSPFWNSREILHHNPLLQYYFDSYYGHYNPFNAEILREGFFNKEWKSEFGLREVLHKPVFVVQKDKSGAENGVVAFFVEHGLSSIVDNPKTRFIHDTLKSGTDKVALVLNANLLHNIGSFKTLKDTSVSKVEIPAGFKLFNVMRATSRHVPYVVIMGKEEFNNIDVEGLVRFGSLDVTDKSVVCNKCN